MGRKRKAAKARSDANENESSNPPLDSMKNEQTSPTTLPSKKKGSNKASKDMNAITRRSGRLRNLSLPMSNKGIIVEEIDLDDSGNKEQPLVEEMNSEPISKQLAESEKEEQPLVEELNSEPSLQNLEDKIDFLVQSVQEFQSEGTKRPSSSETQAMELNYRSLYIESRKKIEALTEENHQLAKKLEYATGKAEAFEQMKDAFGNMKNMLFLSLGRATETVMNLSSPAATGKFSLPEPTTHNAIAANEHKTTSTTTGKKYRRKGKDESKTQSPTKKKKYGEKAEMNEE